MKIVIFFIPIRSKIPEYNDTAKSKANLIVGMT